MLPLVLLEAMQNIDTPPDDGLGALEHELAAKRLGLSPTLAAQIRRYREQAEDGDEVGRDDVEAIFRLIGRRPDAELVFADAGRRAARFAAREQGGGSRALAAVSPGRLATSVRMRTASSLAARWLLIELRRTDEGPRAEAGGASLALAAGPSGVGCAFYTAALGELLRLVAQFEGVMVHEACRTRGDARCIWRAERASGYE
jgi:hypothetical protein